MLANGTSAASFTARTVSALSATNSDSSRSWRARKIELRYRMPSPRSVNRPAAPARALCSTSSWCSLILGSRRSTTNRLIVGWLMVAACQRVPRPWSSPRGDGEPDGRPGQGRGQERDAPVDQVDVVAERKSGPDQGNADDRPQGEPG